MSEEKMEPDQDLEETNSESQVEEKDSQNDPSEGEPSIDDDATEKKDSKSDDGNIDSEDEMENMKQEVEAAKDKYLRLFSEFENFRRRTARERIELIQTSTEGLMVDLLPILDDFIRAKDSIENGGEITSIEEGVKLIENKLKRILEQKGLKPMEVKQGDEFNSDLHEAVSQIPAPKKKLKGKVVEIIEDGYFLGEKVIRYAKVVIGGE